MSRSTVISDPDNDYLAQVDQFSHHLVTMNEVHARIHDGAFFTAGVYDDAVAAAGTLEILIQTPATGALHIRGTVAGGGNTEVEFYEGTTFSAAGTVITPPNRNRFSSNVANGTWTHTPTTTADGTALFLGLIPGGSGGNASGGTLPEFDEWVLAQSTNYLIRARNITATVQPIAVTVEFYDTNFNNF